MSQNDGGGVILLYLGIFALFFVPASWTYPLWYAVAYQVSPAQVRTPDQPSDCDWTRAPLGRKGCSYKALVKAYNSAGQVVGGDGAPKYGHDTNTGKPIISYDEGKTWAWFPAPATPDLTINSVMM